MEHTNTVRSIGSISNVVLSDKTILLFIFMLENANFTGKIVITPPKKPAIY